MGAIPATALIFDSAKPANARPLDQEQGCG
jgi:hypothetical protein